MFTRMMAAIAFATSAGAIALAPLGAQADEEGGYTLFASSVNDDKTWAVVDTTTEITVVAEKRGGEVTVLSGAEGAARLSAVYDAMPHGDVVELNDGSDMRIITDSGKHKVKLLKLGEGVDVDVETILEQAGLNIDGDITVDTDEGQKVIVISTVKSGDGDTSDVTVQVIKSGDGNSDGLLEMPAPPVPPEPPVTGENGEKITVRSSHKMVFDYDSDDGDNRSFMKTTGVGRDDAAEFIDDIEDLTASEKDRMKAALSL